MNKKIIVGIIVVLAALCIGLLAFRYSNTISTQAVKPESIIPRDKVLVIGTVGEVPADEIAEYQPFIDYVAGKLSNQGIVKGEVVVAQSPAEMSKFMRQNKVDLYIDSPFPVYVVSKLAEATPLVDRWKKGEEKYHSIIFTRKESSIKTLDDLKGKTIAFEGPYSTSGYFLPKAELLKRGYILREKIGPGDVIGPKEIGYYFTNNQEQVALDVLSGKALVGGQNQKDVEESAGDRYDELRSIFKSIDLYRHIIVTRKGMPDALRLSVKDIMVHMNEDPQGIVVLKNFKKTTKLGESKSPDEFFKGVQELTALVESEIIRQ